MRAGGGQLERSFVDQISAHSGDERPWRAVTIARPGLLALVVALTAAARYDVTAWWLVALALIAVAAGLTERVMAHSWPHATAEVAAAALVIGLGMRESYLGLPYLLLPSFAAGLSAGMVGASLATGAGSAGLLLGLVLGADSLDPSTLVSLAPWVAMIFATGGIGAWVRRQRSARTADASRYGAAYRLLSELRVVSRRLSGGLDPVTLATGLLDDVSTRTDARRSALLVRRDGGVLLPLARRGGDDNWLARAEQDQTVLDAWTTEAPTMTAIGRRMHRVVLPLQVGARTIGVVVTDLAEPISQEEIRALSRSTDDGALRLETALLFDEVREIATREERRRLAREIHDGIAQELASLGYLIDDLQARARGADLRSLAITLRKEVTRILSDLRHSIFDLRSDLPADSGIGTALGGYARQVGSQTGLTVHLVHEESHERLRPEVEAELLRIGQEAITNVRKHAKARNLWVTVSVDPPNARIQVADDGVGLGVRPRDRYGLDIMSERARRVGARLVIENRPEGGTVVAVSLGADEGER